MSLTRKQQASRYIASSWAVEMLNKKLLFLDTETTGLTHAAQIVQISIVNKSGDILFDSLVNPNISIPKAASNIHGITDSIVKDAPLWKEVEPKIKSILEGQQIAIFNRKFDIRMLFQTSAKNNISTDWIKALPYERCVMIVASQYFNGRTDKWVNLGKACECLNIDLTNIHMALADTEATRLLLIQIAEYSSSIDSVPCAHGGGSINESVR